METMETTEMIDDDDAVDFEQQEEAVNW